MRRQRPRPRYLNRSAVRRAVGLVAAALLIAVAVWRAAHAEAPTVTSFSSSILIENEA